MVFWIGDIFVSLQENCEGGSKLGSRWSWAREDWPVNNQGCDYDGRACHMDLELREEERTGVKVTANLAPLARKC